MRMKNLKIILIALVVAGIAYFVIGGLFSTGELVNEADKAAQQSEKLRKEAEAKAAAEAAAATEINVIIPATAAPEPTPK